MDLIEIDYHDYLNENTNHVSESVTCWFTNDWENYVLTYCHPNSHKWEPQEVTICTDDVKFRVGDDLICLSEGVFEKEPHTSMSSDFGGRMKTLAILATIFIRDGKLKGKIRIFNTSKPPIDTNYELSLKNAEMKQLIGLKICGDGWDFDNCKYKFVSSDLSFNYFDNSKEISVFDREIDSNKRKLLEQYMLEYITKDLGPALEEYMTIRLGIKELVSNSTGCDYKLKNTLSIHNKKMRKAFRNLAEKIISIAISLLVKESPKLQYTEFFGLVEPKNEKSNVNVYSGYIDKFDSLAVSQDKNPIISNENDLAIIHVPVELQALKLHITKLADGSRTDHKEQTYETSGSHLIMSLKRLSDDEVDINLVNFKVINITPTSETPINIAMDHLITFAIEQHLQPFLKEAMTYKELQELAIKPDVEIEYDVDDDLMAEDSEVDA